MVIYLGAFLFIMLVIVVTRMHETRSQPVGMLSGLVGRFSH